MYEKLKARLAERGLTIDEAKLAARQSIIDYLKQSKTDNKAYLAIVSPTASDKEAQIAKITKQIIRLERLAINDLTGVE